MRHTNKVRNRLQTLPRKQFSTGYKTSGAWDYLALYGNQARETVAYNKSKWFREDENRQAPAIITTKTARKMILIKKIAA